MQVDNSNRISFHARLNLSGVDSCMMDRFQFRKLTQNASRIGNSNDLINVEVKPIASKTKAIRDGFLFSAEYDVNADATIQNKYIKLNFPDWKRLEIYNKSRRNPFYAINEFLIYLHKKFPAYYTPPKIAAQNMYKTMDVVAQDLKRFLFKKQIAIPKSVQKYLKNADVVAQAYANGDLHKFGLTYFRYIGKVQTQRNSLGIKLSPTMKAFVDSLVAKTLNCEPRYNSKYIDIPKRRLYEYVTKNYSFDETINE